MYLIYHLYILYDKSDVTLNILDIICHILYYIISIYILYSIHYTLNVEYSISNSMQYPILCKKVFIINISGDFEFLEDTFENVGVKQQCCVTETPYGIVWVNKSGCYLYDGSQLTNLIENKISPYQTTGYVGNYWRVEDNVPVIGYSQKDDIILINLLNKISDKGAINEHD